MPKFSKEDELLCAIFNEPLNSPIGDRLPCGYHDGRMDRNSELDTMLDVKISGQSTASMDEDFGPDTKAYPELWDGPDKWVFRWWTLENGKKVAWLNPPDPARDEFIVR